MFEVRFVRKHETTTYALMDLVAWDKDSRTAGEEAALLAGVNDWTSCWRTMGWCSGWKADLTVAVVGMVMDVKERAGV
jgi:hypothetical protein